METAEVYKSYNLAPLAKSSAKHALDQRESRRVVVPSVVDRKGPNDAMQSICSRSAVVKLVRSSTDDFTIEYNTAGHRGSVKVMIPPVVSWLLA